MKFSLKVSAEWPLRLGLGIMYLYSGYDIFFNTQQWKGYIPSWFFHIITPITSLDSYLRVQAIGEIALAIIFVSWFLPRRIVLIAAMLASIEMAFILLFVGIDRVTFRDIGLLGGTLAILLFSLRKDGTIQQN